MEFKGLQCSTGTKSNHQKRPAYLSHLVSHGPGCFAPAPCSLWAAVHTGRFHRQRVGQGLDFLGHSLSCERNDVDLPALGLQIPAMYANLTNNTVFPRTGCSIVLDILKLQGSIDSCHPQTPAQMIFQVLLVVTPFLLVVLSVTFEFRASSKLGWSGHVPAHETNNLPLQINVWKINSPFGVAYFEGLC